jgi:glycosidase
LIDLEEKPETVIRLGNDLLELEFDGTTGHWLALTDRRDGRTVLHSGELVRPVLLTAGGRTQVSRGYNQLVSVVDTETVGLHWTLEGFSRTADEHRVWLLVHLREGDWRVTLRYGLRTGGDRLERGVRIEYIGDGEALLRYLTLRLPYLSLGNPVDCFFEAPGHPVRPRRRVSHLLPFGPQGMFMQGAFNDAPAWRPPLVGVHNPAEQRAFALWSHTETEPFYPAVDRTEQGLLLSHRIYLADRFRSGHSLEWGTQYVQIHHSDWMTALSDFQGFYDEVGFRTPEDVPQWARSINLHEVHVGTLTGTNLAPYTTYEPLIADLPRIRDTGYDAVYIMPHVPYPSYSVIDYLDMEIQQGSDAGFRAFIERAHELGLKVFMDVTMHGVMDRRARRLLDTLEGHSATSYPFHPTMPEVHPYVVDHPEWFSRNEAGEIAMTYTYSFDHANASWQDFMSKVFRHYVEEYDLDGFRVDSHTWNFFPNWARDLPYPASHSFYGSAQLFKRIRAELKAIKPDVVLYTETAGPLLHTSHELGYNYDETWLLLSTLPLVSRRGMLCHFAQAGHVTGHRMCAAEIAEWLAQRQFVLPRGAIKVHHLDCHDTYWGPKEFRSHTFGTKAARAIVGFFAFIEGGFMDYNGADAGSEAFYRRVIHLRKTQPALYAGTCDYLAVKPSNPMVLPPLRQSAGQTLLPLIHFDNQRSNAHIPLPLGRMGLDAEAYLVKDLMTNRALPSPTGRAWRRDELEGFTVEMAPYAVRLLDFKPSATTDQ